MTTGLPDTNDVSDMTMADLDLNTVPSPDATVTDALTPDMGSPDLTAQSPLDDHFVTTWKTDNAGSIFTQTMVTIPTGTGTFNYDVDWDNDGTFDELGVTGDATHDYGQPGTYTVRIRVDFPHFRMAASIERLRLLSVDQWGTIAWQSMASAFEGCSNLRILATDTPDLSAVTDMSSMFDGAGIVNTDLNAWDVSNVTDMSSIFLSSGFNQPLNTWDTSNVTDMSLMFEDATAFNQPLDMSNLASLTAAISMLDRAGLSRANYDATLIGWDAQMTTASGVFFGAANLTYCMGEVARNNLINNRGWQIFDGGKNCL